MPRDGSNIYHRPPGTDGVPDTSIESAKYNTYVADVEQDLNLPRPIIAGGTGATDAASALANLSGELAGQVIGNYDSAVWQAGSFYSAAGATSAPVAGHAFVGWVYSSDPVPTPPSYIPLNQNLVVQARDQNDTVTPGRLYVREKKAGVWGAWKVDGRTIVDTSEGIGSDTADMFFGVTGVAPASSFIVNNKANVTGSNWLNVTKAGVTTISGIGATIDATTGLIRLKAADSNASIIFSGATKGVRLGFAPSGSSIEGVDNTGTGSYQPIAISGSYVSLSIPGSPTLLALNNTTVGIVGPLAVSARITASTDIYVNPATGPANLLVGSSQAAQQSLVYFFDAGASKWQLGKHVDNSFMLYDIASSRFVIQALAGGNLIFSPAGGFTTIIGTATITGEAHVAGAVVAGGLTAGPGTAQINIAPSGPHSSIEMGDLAGTAAVGSNIPFFDWHYATGVVQDFNFRMQNISDGRMFFSTARGACCGFVNDGSFNGIVLQLNNSYLNFGNSYGSGGWGIRDDGGGNVNVKCLNGTWNGIVSNVRLLFIGDVVSQAAMQEPYAGAVITGHAFQPNPGNPYMTARYRYLQGYVNANWFTVAYN